ALREGDAQRSGKRPIPPDPTAESHQRYTGLAVTGSLAVQHAQRDGIVVLRVATQIQQRLALEHAGDQMLGIAVLVMESDLPPVGRAQAAVIHALELAAARGLRNAHHFFPHRLAALLGCLAKLPVPAVLPVISP